MAHLYQTKNKHGKPHPRWKYQFLDYQGRKRTRTGTASKRETEKIAAAVEAEQLKIRCGLSRPLRPYDVVRKIDSVISEYLNWGNTQGGRRGYPWGPEHARKRMQHLKFWRKELRLRTQLDLVEVLPKVERVINRLRRDGRTGKTIWEQCSSLRAFCNWMLDRDYLEENPLRKLKKINTDPVKKRRALTPEEISRLLAHCLPERRLLYEAALCTGLRANELRQLTSLHLDGVNCRLRLEGKWTKNRQCGYQPVPQWLMDKLKAVSQDLEPEEAIFKIQKTHPARMVQDDLKRAGIPVELPGEGRVDFHSLRVTYCTLLDEGGASAKETQELARHSTPSITMQRYVKTRQKRIENVVEALGTVINCTESSEHRPNSEKPELRVLKNAS